MLVGFAKSACHHFENMHDATGWHGPGSNAYLFERRAFDELHHVVKHALVRTAVIVDDHGVRMAELAGQLDLALESRHGLLPCGLGRKQLDGDRPLHQRMTCSVHHPHATRADLFAQHVLAKSLGDPHFRLQPVYHTSDHAACRAGKQPPIEAERNQKATIRPLKRERGRQHARPTDAGENANGYPHHRRQDKRVFKRAWHQGGTHHEELRGNQQAKHQTGELEQGPDKAEVAAKHEARVGAPKGDGAGQKPRRCKAKTEAGRHQSDGKPDGFREAHRRQRAWFAAREQPQAEHDKVADHETQVAGPRDSLSLDHVRDGSDKQSRERTSPRDPS